MNRHILPIFLYTYRRRNIGGNRLGKKLERNKEENILLTGVIDRYALKKESIGGKSIRIRLSNVEIIYQDGQFKTLENVWVNVGKTLAKMNIPEDSVLQLNGYITERLEGHVWFDHQEETLVDGRKSTFTVKQISNVQVLAHGDGLGFKDFYQRVKVNDLISSKYNDLAI